MSQTSVTDIHTGSPLPSPLSMALAVLPPSPLSLVPAARVTPSFSKRPKLSLNTAHLPVAVGKSTTGLRLETLSVASPTSRNTYNNAFGHQTNPESTGNGRVQPRLFIRTPCSTSTPRLNMPTPLRTSSSDSIHSCSSNVSGTSATSSASSISSTSTTDSLPAAPAYRLPFSHSSILTNSPLPRPRRRKSFTTTRPMFPLPKRVSFRTPLIEEIHTQKYTLSHADLDILTSPPILRLNSHPQFENDQLAITDEPATPTAKKNVYRETRKSDLATTPKSPKAGEKRDSSDEDSDVCPSTPVTRHNKRPREWVWTLGPIEPCSTTAVSGDGASQSQLDSAAIDHENMAGFVGR